MSTNDRDELAAARGAGARARRRDARVARSPAACTWPRRARSPCIVGGDAAVSTAQRPLLEAMGERVFHVGPLGSASDQGHHEHARLHPSRRRRRGADAREARRRSISAGLRGHRAPARATASSTRRRASVILNGTYDIGFTHGPRAQGPGLRARARSASSACPSSSPSLVERDSPRHASATAARRGRPWS